MIRSRIVLLTMVCALFGASLSIPARAIDQASPLVIGETFTIVSKIMKETRRLNVYLPPAYTASPDTRSRLPPGERTREVNICLIRALRLIRG